MIAAPRCDGFSSLLLKQGLKNKASLMAISFPEFRYFIIQGGNTAKGRSS